LANSYPHHLYVLEIMFHPFYVDQMLV
jgi:hypothetical protein